MRCSFSALPSFVGFSFSVSYICVPQVRWVGEMLSYLTITPDWAI